MQRRTIASTAQIGNDKKYSGSKDPEISVTSKTSRRPSRFHKEHVQRTYAFEFSFIGKFNTMRRGIVRKNGEITEASENNPESSSGVDQTWLVSRDPIGIAPISVQLGLV
jgi:hypothetical protein